MTVTATAPTNGANKAADKAKPTKPMSSGDAAKWVARLDNFVPKVRATLLDTMPDDPATSATTGAKGRKASDYRVVNNVVIPAMVEAGTVAHRSGFVTALVGIVDADTRAMAEAVKVEGDDHDPIGGAWLGQFSRWVEFIVGDHPELTGLVGKWSQAMDAHYAQSPDLLGAEFDLFLAELGEAAVFAETPDEANEEAEGEEVTA